MTKKQFQGHLFELAQKKLEDQGLNLHAIPTHWPVSRRSLYYMKDGKAGDLVMQRLAEFLEVKYEVEYKQRV